jgi:predicted Zn-dependent peptidase
MNRHRAAAVGLLVLTLALPVAADADTTRREQLDNGFTVLVRENPLAPVVAVSLMVRMGTRWESEERAGISNFVHAVMVKGTARRGGAELAESIAAMGGKLSAAGDVDFSGISGTALARFWRELLALTAELALEPRLPAEEVGPERDWLLSRVQRQRDSPSSRAFDVFYATVYGPHPYGLPVLGTPESLGRLDHAAIVAHYRAFLPTRADGAHGERTGQSRRGAGRSPTSLRGVAAGRRRRRAEPPPAGPGRAPHRRGAASPAGPDPGRWAGPLA